MQAIKNFILWLTLAFASVLPTSALIPIVPENRVWEIFSIGYDAPIAEATNSETTTETSTSNYDTAPIHCAITEKIPTEANRSLSGPNSEFKSAEDISSEFKVPAGLNRNGIFGNRSGSISWDGYPDLAKTTRPT